MKGEFDRVYEIMKEAFPAEEMRTYEGQKALLDEKNYSLICKRNQENKIVAFMTLWKNKEFSFIEHLATAKEERGSGIGSKFLKEYMENCSTPIILEVEPPTTDIAKRRIEFYERLGFHLTEFLYQQPQLQEGVGSCMLQIMSYPRKIGKEEFEKYKKILFKDIYKIENYSWVL